jgi:predicted O-methyltransferase YrrM
MDVPSLDELAHWYWTALGYPMQGMRCPSMCSPGELGRLMVMVADGDVPAGDVLEIGTAWAGTTVGLCLAAARRNPDERVWTVDPWVEQWWGGFGGAGAYICAQAVMRHLKNCVPVSGTSDDMRRLAGDRRPFRFVLVDGDHSHEWVLRDLSNAAAMTTIGGIIAMHDVGLEEPGPYGVWQELAEGISGEYGEVRLLPLERVERLGILRVVRAEESYRPGHMGGGAGVGL